MSVKISITANVSKCPMHTEHTTLLPSSTKSWRFLILYFPHTYIRALSIHSPIFRWKHRFVNIWFCLFGVFLLFCFTKFPFHTDVWHVKKHSMSLLSGFKKKKKLNSSLVTQMDKLNMAYLIIFLIWFFCFLFLSQ